MNHGHVIANVTKPEPTTNLPRPLRLEQPQDIRDDRPTEIIIDDVALRRLDARYYFYLAENLEKAEKAYQDDKLPAAALAFTLARFARVERWAVEHIGEE